MRALITAAALMLMCAGPTVAETFVPAPHGAYELDLDTASGKLSSWTLKNLAGINAVRAKAVVLRLGEDEKWAPSFGFHLLGGDERVAFFIQSRVLAPARDRGSASGPRRAPAGPVPLVMWVEHAAGSAKPRREPFVSFIELGETVDVLLDWTPEGQVTVRLGSKQTRALKDYETHAARLPAAPTALWITSSTGEMMVKSLEVGAVRR